MTENNIILTSALFQALNTKRKNKGFPPIENAQIAIKLGILFTLKTHNYISFKGESVVLNDTQILELRTIIKEHFNVDLTKENLSPIVTQEKRTTNGCRPAPSLQSGGLTNKIKELSKIESKLRAIPLNQ